MERCQAVKLTIQNHLSAEAKRLCLHNSTPIYAFMAWCFATHSNHKHFSLYSMTFIRIWGNDRSLLYRIKKIQVNGIKYTFTSI